MLSLFRKFDEPYLFNVCCLNFVAKLLHLFVLICISAVKFIFASLVESESFIFLFKFFGL